jgi:hypothetical protein
MRQRSLIAALLLLATACTHSDPQPPPDPHKPKDSPLILIRDVPSGLLPSPTPQAHPCYVRYERCMTPDGIPAVPCLLGIDRCSGTAQARRLGAAMFTAL